MITSKVVEAGDLIGRELGGIGEELLEANGVDVASIFEELVEEFEGREQVVLLEKEIHDAVAERRFLHIHRSIHHSRSPLPLSLSLSLSDRSKKEKNWKEA